MTTPSRSRALALEWSMRSRIIFTLCFISVVVGQPFFTAHTITDGADYATFVFAMDIVETVKGIIIIE